MRNPFRKLQPTHPDIPKHEIEVAWKDGRETFYRFKEISHLMTKGRAIYVNSFLATLDKYKVTPESFADWRGAIRSCLNVNKKGEINLGLAHKLLDQLEEREVMFSPFSSACRVLALSTFKLTDDLAGAPDEAEITRRINLIKKKEMGEVWQTKPLPDLFKISADSAIFSKKPLNLLEKGEAIITAQNLFWMRIAGS